MRVCVFFCPSAATGKWCLITVQPESAWSTQPGGSSVPSKHPKVSTWSPARARWRPRWAPMSPSSFSWKRFENFTFFFNFDAGKGWLCVCLCVCLRACACARPLASRPKWTRRKFDPQLFYFPFFWEVCNLCNLLPCAAAVSCRNIADSMSNCVKSKNKCCWMTLLFFSYIVASIVRFRKKVQ